MENMCCQFNKCVDCIDHNKCWKCGWNPEVARERVREWEIKRRLESNDK